MGFGALTGAEGHHITIGEAVEIALGPTASPMVMYQGFVSHLKDGGSMLSKYHWVRGANGNVSLISDVARVLGPDVTIVEVLIGKLILSDGREAWRAGPDWIIGQPADLRRLWDSL